jgi:hypothetical protein
MEQLPIPEAADTDREAIAELAWRCNTLGQRRYDLQENVRRRLTNSFAEYARGEATTLNLKAQAWWTLSSSQLGEALKSSFKLKASPFKNPRTADEWEPYFEEKRRGVELMSRERAATEAELNQRVYALFHLTPEEIALLQREVEH